MGRKKTETQILKRGRSAVGRKVNSPRDRESGNMIRNDVINVIKRTKQPVKIDFTGIDHATSSFVDEFLAKMVLYFGVIEFSQMVKIVGMNDTIKHLTNRSIYMRVATSWNEAATNDE